MKVQPSPTSPKIHVEENANSSSRWRRILLVSVLAGIIGGILSLALFRIVLTYYSASPFVKFFRLPQETEVRIIQETKIVAEEQAQLGDLREKILPQTLALFSKKDAGQIQDVFTTEDFVGYAVILTSDGLAFTHDGVIQDPSVPLVAVTHDYRQFEVKDVLRDPASRFIFFSIAASDLSVAQFGNPEDETLGSRGFLISHSGLANGGEILPAALVSGHVTAFSSFEDAFSSTEDLKGEFLLSTPFAASFNGAPISTADGKILGLATSAEGFARGIPVSHIQPILENVIQRKRQLERPRFGAQYLDLSEAMNVPADLSGARTAGALLISSSAVSAVVQGGPAERAGLREGDILLSLDGVLLNGRTRLQEEIQKRHIGNSVQISYVRDGVSKEVEIILDAQGSL